MIRRARRGRNTVPRCARCHRRLRPGGCRSSNPPSIPTSCRQDRIARILRRVVGRRGGLRGQGRPWALPPGDHLEHIRMHSGHHRVDLQPRGRDMIQHRLGEWTVPPCPVKGDAARIGGESHEQPSGRLDRRQPPARKRRGPRLTHGARKLRPERVVAATASASLPGFGSAGAMSWAPLPTTSATRRSASPGRAVRKRITIPTMIRMVPACAVSLTQG